MNEPSVTTAWHRVVTGVGWGMTQFELEVAKELWVKSAV